MAAQLHDVGKVALATRVVRSGERESDDLVELKRARRTRGELLNGGDFASDSLPAIRHHHERWDGRGYPDGSRRRRHPAERRIIAVADAFDALTTARPDRPALDPRRATR